MAGFSGKGKERLCKDELFVAIFASIKLNRDRVRALRFDRGEARIVPTKKKRIKDTYREGGKLDGCKYAGINVIFPRPKNSGKYLVSRGKV